MLNTLITAIARLLGVKAPSMEVSVQLTQTAGLAHQEPTTQRGNKRSAQPTKPRPVKPAVKAKSARVLKATQAQSQAQEQAPVQQQQERQSGVRGRKQATPVSKSAKQKPKRKPSAAQSTTAAVSRKPKQKPVQPAAKASGATGSQPRTRASKTRQHAK